MTTRCVIANPDALMERYLDGNDALSNDEREILLFALYMESVERKGLAHKVQQKMGVWVSPIQLSRRERQGKRR